MPSERLSQEPDDYLDLDASTNELGDKVQQVRAELETLKQKQEEIEREKLRLEELKRRQDELDVGRSDMLDKLTRSLVVVQREIEESQKRVEQMHTIYNAFTQHLRQLEGINSRMWGSADMPRELSKALSSVEDARSEYMKAQAKLAVDLPQEAPAASPQETDYSYYEEKGFSYWLKSGFAFTLPLQILGWIVLIVWIWAITSTLK